MAPGSDSAPDLIRGLDNERTTHRGSGSSPGAGEIVAEARAWIGTPFHHQASVKGVGTDCLGLIRGIWRALYGDEPEPVPAYTPDWAEATGDETMLRAARRWLIEVDLGKARPGDVLLFRLKRDGPARHCGILSRRGSSSGLTRVSRPMAADPRVKPEDDSKRMIHAWSNRAVAEVPFDTAWQRRLSHVFRFPPR